jgi:hypothetical protein
LGDNPIYSHAFPYYKQATESSHLHKPPQPLLQKTEGAKRTRFLFYDHLFDTQADLSKTEGAIGTNSTIKQNAFSSS